MHSKNIDSLKLFIKAGLVGLLIVLVFIVSAGNALSQLTGVEISPSHTRQADSGQTVVYDHVLTNTSPFTDTFALEVGSTLGWPVELVGGDYPTGTVRLPFRLGAQMTASFQVSLTVPIDARGVTEVTIVTATSLTTPTIQDVEYDTTIVSAQLYLPLILRRWPPIPYSSTLNHIENSDGDGLYTVSWSATELAETYELEESESEGFTSSDTVYIGSSHSWSVDAPGKTAGTYYYRVRACNVWGCGGYSSIASVTVLPPTVPTLNAIDNDDGDHNYDVTWSSATRATNYTLQESADEGFGNAVTAYEGTGLSWSVTNKPSGIYYYRVRSSGPTGQSNWSNTQSVTVPPPPSPLGDGFYLVGSEIKPGKWHSTGTGTSCYWARYDANQNILDNHFGLAGGTVTVRDSDHEVEFSRCGMWEYVEYEEKVLQPDADQSKGDGFYTVGVEIKPGMWRSTGTGTSCYWARLDGYQDILDNHFGQAGGTVTVRSTDYEVEFHRCGTWIFLGE